MRKKLTAHSSRRPASRRSTKATQTNGSHRIHAGGSVGRKPFWSVATSAGPSRRLRLIARPRTP
ncbi:hypothetical protein [Streptomyces sp. NPDC093514]|uniref:hypothetical protein n=1 Tax=Streptomyces sp. NPDC093514 TaxID=3366039 RepID=UPI003813FAAD